MTHPSLETRKADMQERLQTVAQQINQAQQKLNEMQVLEQRLIGAIAMLDELIGEAKAEPIEAPAV